MKIRKASKEDVKELVSLDKQAFTEYLWWTPMTRSEFAELIEKDMVYVAEDKEIMGYINAKKEKNTLYLDNIFIKKEFRKHGIATSLMKEFISKYKKKDIVLHCPERLCGFYEKFGFGIKYIEMKRKREEW